MSKLQKIAQIIQAVLDQVTGADLPTLYYHPHGEIRRILDYLPQLKEKYRPTPWLSNTHVHLLYFDLIKKKKLAAHTLKTIVLDEADNLLDNTSSAMVKDLIK